MMRFKNLVAIGAATACLLLARTAQAGPKDLPTCESPYYIIKSDLDKQTVQEAYIRLTTMAQEYARRTAGFGGKITKKLPFVFFAKVEDYYAAGGVPGSAGCYNGQSLMTFAQPKGREALLWQVMQHEGFHQFARSVVRGDLPVWCNEGLAEYFGHGMWTGDGFITGLVPPHRLKRVKAMIRNDDVLPFLEMVTMDHGDWNGALKIRNYDQAWSMIHFLVHADGGKYQGALAGFINDVSARKPVKQAFVARFGNDTAAFQKSYARWWSDLNDNPTAELYAEATVATLNSFLARAWASGQKFASFDEFIAAARGGKLVNRTDQWLPQSLLDQAVQDATKYEQWSLQAAGNRAKLILKLDSGTALTGTFVAAGRTPTKIEVTASKPSDKKPASAPASAANKPGKK